MAKAIKSTVLMTLAMMTATAVQAQTPTVELRTLIKTAIERGQATGWVGGSVAADFNRNIGMQPETAQPIQATLTRLERLSPACGRISFDLSRPGQTALAPDGKRYPQRIAWGMNICTSGMPGVTQ